MVKYVIDRTQQYPAAKIFLQSGEYVYIERGSMIYHTPSIALNTKSNSKSKGLGGVISSIGRKIVSNESMFITEARANGEGVIAIASNSPGQIVELELGKNQYYLNDGAFLAMDSTANTEIQSQGFGKALFGGTGGFFIMKTTGYGKLLISVFGSIERIDLTDETFIVDNNHVVAWDSSLDYNIKLENGFLNSIGTGEGLVNEFRGTGSVYIQTLNLESFANALPITVKNG